jgi:Delta3-Delta2-enoyl-CoA isomerase
MTTTSDYTDIKVEVRGRIGIISVTENQALPFVQVSKLMDSAV